MDEMALRSLTCGYAGQTILSDLNVSYAPGEFCALLGLNGAGKSTLLRTVSGMLPALSGSCMLGSENLAGLKVRQRAKHVSFIPQRPSALEGISVWEVLLMGLNPWLGLLESPGKIQRDEVREIGIRMGIGEYIEKDFSSLSEGQKQLVLLARAAVQNTPVMLMDEPDSALDYVNRHEMMQRLADLVHETKKICLIATHDPNLALEYCDRILILKNGTIKQDFSTLNTDKIQAEQALTDLYGNIAILEYKGKHYMAFK